MYAHVAIATILRRRARATRERRSRRLRPQRAMKYYYKCRLLLLLQIFTRLLLQEASTITINVGSSSSITIHVNITIARAEKPQASPSAGGPTGSRSEGSHRVMRSRPGKTVRWENSLDAFWKSKGAAWTEVETGLWDELIVIWFDTT